MRNAETPGRSYVMQSRRLGFGIWQPGDLDLAIAIWGDDAITAMNGGPFSRQAIAERMALEIANHARHGSQYWPIFALEDDSFVGCCGLRPRDLKSRTFELGFYLRCENWGQGYAAEAGRRVIDWCADNHVAALFAGHHPDNHASGRTLRGLGFVYTHDELYLPSGAIEPCYLLRL